MIRFFPLTILLGGALALHAVDTASVARGYKGPIHASLIKYINVRHLQPGASVFVKVNADWSGLNCTLRKGAIIEAKVETAVPHVKHGTGSHLALSFSKAQCGGAEMAPLDLFLAAVSYVPQNSGSDTFPVVRYMLSPAISQPGSTGPTSMFGGLGGSSQETMLTHADEFTSMKGGPASFKPGEVYGIKGVTMKLDGGPHHSSLLSDQKHDIALEQGTEFVLVPTSLVLSPTVAASGVHTNTTIAAADVTALATAAPPPPREFEPCKPPACNNDLPMETPATAHLSGGAVESIPIKPLGYAPRPEEPMTELNDDQALAWLGPHRLLIAFNPHKLVYRDGISTAYAPVRTVRAVLLDTAAKEVLSTADWQLSDYGKYLWKIAGDRIVVHAGNDLRVYNSQLRLVKQLPLAGPLDFLRISPNGEVIAVAVIKERHTPQLHAQLRENLGHDPEEDVEVQILDRNFKTIVRASTTSNIVPPTLLNEGQLNILAQPHHRYRLSLLTWRNLDKTLATFSSQCTPQLSTLAPDLAMVRSCEMTYGAGQIRILRADGKVVMENQPDVDEVDHEAMGNPASDTFVLKVLYTAGARSQGSVFRGSDLHAVELRVYRASDGKRLATIRTSAPPPSHGGYGLSPDGSHIAVVAGGQVNIFPVPAQ